MTPKPKVFDKRGLVGMMLRGKNSYGPNTSPNPVGKNQHQMIQKAARARIRNYGR